MAEFLTKIKELNIGEKYFYQRPSLSWVLAGGPTNYPKVPQSTPKYPKVPQSTTK